eukprot:COSAG02_NODE_3420_length_6777_cov_2.529051_2_plen_1033_part_00
MQQSAGVQSELESSQLVVRFVGSKLSSDLSDDVGDERHNVPEPEQDEDTEAATQLSIVGTLQCENEDWFPKFEDKRVELSHAGMLTVVGRKPADLTKPGTQVGQPKKLRAGRPFCVRIDCVEPVCKFVLDTGSTEEQQRWLSQLRAVSGTSDTQTTEHREYSFVISAGDEELKRIVIRYRSASAVHKKLQAAGVVAGLTFPGSVFDAAKDFTRTEANWRQRAQDLERYYAELMQRRDAVSHPDFKANFGFDFAELAERHSRVSVKVLKDPELLPRAMAFLGITGEILNPQYEHAPALAERVFLRPQWLVDIMKELVHHDLHVAVEKITADDTSDAVLVKELGRQFCSKGVLDRRLIPWLWRNLPFPLTQSEAEVTFVLELLTQLGLLTLLPQQEEPLWLLPLRLPPKDLQATASVALAQAKFAAFLGRMGAADLLQGIENVAVLSLKEALSYIKGAAAVAQAAIDLAYRFADELLSAGPDPHGLTRDDIAAIHLYTQNDQIFTKLNRALRSEERQQVKHFWGYIRLLQHAIFKLPCDASGTLLRGIKVTWMALEDYKAQLEEKRASQDPEVWWAFSSSSTSMPAVEEFLGAEGPRVIFTIDQGSSARDILRYSAFPTEAERLLPAGTAFTVKTIGSPAPDLLLVTLKQTDCVLLQGGGTQMAVAAPASPAQDETLIRFGNQLSTTAVDEVGRGYEFHQPLPSGLMAVAISGCASLCGKQTSVWRQAISTIVTDRASGVQLEVSMFQSGLSRIDFTARCAAGSHHDLCLQRLKGFEEELRSVLSERWQGCTYTELCLGPGLQPGSARMTTCRHAVERGELVVTVGDDEVSLVSLLGSSGVSPLDAETQAMATVLQFFRAMAVGLTGSFGTTGMCRRFCAELDGELDRQLGGTFADGYCWSSLLQAIGGLSVAAAGEDLKRTEAEAVASGKSRACALLGSLGRLYERSHLLLSGSAELSSMRDVLASLVSPFAWLRPAVLRLAESHHMQDVEAPEIAKAFEVSELVASIPEGVPPQQPQQQMAEHEVEPEPEPQ